MQNCHVKVKNVTVCNKDKQNWIWEMSNVVIQSKLVRRSQCWRSYKTHVCFGTSTCVTWCSFEQKEYLYCWTRRLCIWYYRHSSICTVNAQWLAIVLGRHFWFPVPLGIHSICLYSPKSIVEFEFCAKKAISGIYGLENSQKFLKKAKNF